MTSPSAPILAISASLLRGLKYPKKAIRRYNHSIKEFIAICGIEAAIQSPKVIGSAAGKLYS